MSAEPSLAVRLFGTEEPVAPPRVLKAGPLTAEFEAGNLRYIRFGGVELIRAISFIVRNRNWGTYSPSIENLVVDEAGGGFRVRYDATTKDAEQEFAYSAEIEGKPDGNLTFRAKGRPVTNFVTNRTGFVVLHPGDRVSGEPVEIEHVDGSRENGTFPVVIDPVQPMMDLRALTHEAAPGLRVTCRMEGDTYEMEDQRNWTDASFKTYVRPLALPWPYPLEAGTVVEQAVTLSVEGLAGTAVAEDRAIIISVGQAEGEVPPLGIGLDPDDAGRLLDHAETLALLGIHHVVCRHDPRRGHDRRALEQAIAAAKALGAEPWLEVVVASIDGFEAEIAALGETLRTLGSPFGTVLVSPAPDLKCTLPGSEWPPCPPLSDVYRAARKAFPNARLGGGMFSYFTELNRKRPPVERIDFVTFTTSAMVHAGDDRSVMEGLGALPYIATSAREIAGDKPFVVGPSAIGMRDNPYGEAPMDNPKNIRQAMNRNDPRQRGLLGAAWNVGYFSHFATGGASAITLGGGVGPFGLVHTPAAWPQPWYDEAGGLYPLYHVIRGLAGMAGKRRRKLTSSAPQVVQGIAVEADGGRELWIANLGGEPQQVRLEGFETQMIFMLDADSFVGASRDSAIADAMTKISGNRPLTLAPYAVARLRGR